MRQDCIKITATLLIPYTKNQFGATAAAEKIALDLEAYVSTNEAVTVDSWKAKHTSVDAGT